MKKAGTKIAGDFFADINLIIRKYNTDDAPDELLIRETNNAISELYEKSGGKDDPVYRTKMVIPKGEAVSVINVKGNMTSYNKDTKELTVPNEEGTSTYGVVWYGDVKGFTDNYVGQQGIISEYRDWQDPGIGTNLENPDAMNAVIKIDHVIKVASVVGLNKVILEDNDITVNIAGNKIGVQLAVSNQVDNIDLSAMEEYYSIDRICMIRDSINPVVLEYPEIKFETIAGTPLIYNNYREMVLWCRSGSTIKMFKGSLLAYGIREMIYMKYPDKIKTLDEILDIKDNNINLLQNKILRKLARMGYQIGNDGIDEMQNLNEQKQGEMEKEIRAKNN